MTTTNISPVNAHNSPKTASFACNPDCQFDRDCTREHLLHHVRSRIPTRITFDQIDLLPAREDLLDQAHVGATRDAVAANEPVLFLPTSVYEEEHTRMGYRVHLYGILPCGSNACVILDNIDVNVDIMVPEESTPSQFDTFLRGMMTNAHAWFKSIEDIQLYPFHGFRERPVAHKRVHFKCLPDRRKFIDLIAEVNQRRVKSGAKPLITAGDDIGRRSYYFAKLAREYGFKTCGWNRIARYTSAPGDSRAQFTFKVNMADFKKLPKRDRAALNSELQARLTRDRTMVMQWDIETWRSIQNGQVPEPTDQDFVIFMICAAYFWHYSPEPLMSICAVEHESNAVPGASVTVVCGDEANVLRAHIACMSRMRANIFSAFNGANFDWPLTLEKIRRYGQDPAHRASLNLVSLSRAVSMLNDWREPTEDSVYKWCFRRGVPVKISAESRHDLKIVADFPGVIDTDSMPVFLKLYPRAEVRKAASLNFFLAKNGLPSKEDMPYKRMFHIYERAQALAKIPACHCDQPRSRCTVCTEVLPDLDCEPASADSAHGASVVTSMEAAKWSDKPYPGITTECCACSRTERNVADMTDVGRYCLIDCIRPQQLFVKRMIIPDRRELSVMSYVTLLDSFYRADGMKVRNFLGKQCRKQRIAFSNGRVDRDPKDKEHYPGAWVFPPKRGLNNRRPITGLDFSSLYPSLKMTYNFSPDMVVFMPEEAERLRDAGYTLEQIGPFTYEKGLKKHDKSNTKHATRGWVVRHNGIHSARDSRVIDQYRKFTELIDPTTKKPIPETRTEVQPLGQVPDAPHRVIYEPVRGREALPNERMGVFAYSVKKIFDKRVPVKARFVRLSKVIEKMEKLGVETLTDDGETFDIHEAEFEVACVDSKQRAIKVLANTFYGESGNFNSPIYQLLVAAGITCAGQRNIKLVADFVTKEGFEVQYGDSVTGDTPVLCRFPSGHIGYRTISSLAQKWDPYGDKEAATLTGVETWTERGWTKLNRVIRHYTNKRIFRVLTHTGCVDVTEDHSLLNERAEKVKPSEVQVGSSLLHADLPSTGVRFDTTLDPHEAYAMGLFWADGSCGVYGKGQNIKYSWAINNQNLDYLNRAKEALEVLYNRPFKILNTMKSSHVYKLVPTGEVKDIVEYYRSLFYHESKDTREKAYKYIPDVLLNAPLMTKMLFVQGYYAGDGDKDKNGYFRADNRGKIGSAGLYFLFTEVGHKMSINDRADKPDIYRLTGAQDGAVQKRDPHKIKRIRDLGCTSQYVYDLETENHHFSAGVGRMIVHNTDSVYLTGPDSAYADIDAKYADVAVANPTCDNWLERRQQYWTELVTRTMKVITNIRNRVVDKLMLDNGTLFLSMAYEEVGFPTVLCGKKKYYMTPHIEEVNFYPKSYFIRGIDIVKQGQAGISRELGEEFIAESLSPANRKELIEIAESKIHKYYTETGANLKKFIMNACYKPHKKNASVHKFVARMREMQARHSHDPHLLALYEPPEPGDKFEYVIVRCPTAYTITGCKISLSKGDQMEYVRVFLASQSTPNPMQLDLSYYMDKYVTGLFARYIAYHPDFQPAPGKFDPDTQYKEMDKYCIDEASKHIRQLCNTITGHNADAIRATGSCYQRVYRMINKELRRDIVDRYGVAGVMMYLIDADATGEPPKASGSRAAPKLPAGGGDRGPARSTRVLADLIRKAEAQASEARDYTTVAEETVRAGIAAYGKVATGRMYGTQYRMMQKGLYDEQYRRAREDMFNGVMAVIGIVDEYNKRIRAFIEDTRRVKTESGIDVSAEEICDLNDLEHEEVDALKALHGAFTRMVSAKIQEYNVRAVVGAAARLATTEIIGDDSSA